MHLYYARLRLMLALALSCTFLHLRYRRGLQGSGHLQACRCDSGLPLPPFLFTSPSWLAFLQFQPFVTHIHHRGRPFHPPSTTPYGILVPFPITVLASPSPTSRHVDYPFNGDEWSRCGSARASCGESNSPGGPWSRKPTSAASQRSHQ